MAVDWQFVDQQATNLSGSISSFVKNEMIGLGVLSSLKFDDHILQME